MIKVAWSSHRTDEAKWFHHFSDGLFPVGSCVSCAIQALQKFSNFIFARLSNFTGQFDIQVSCRLRDKVCSLHINEHDVPWWFGAGTKRPVSTVEPVSHCQSQQQLETAERGHSRKEISHQRTFAPFLYFLADVPRAVDRAILVTLVDVNPSSLQDRLVWRTIHLLPYAHLAYEVYLFFSGLYNLFRLQFASRNVIVEFLKISLKEIWLFTYHPFLSTVFQLVH